MIEEFARGSIVCLRSNAAIRGPVVDVLQGQPETRYMVWHDNGVHQYYARQLTSVDMAVPAPQPLDRFKAHLTAMQILHPGISALYSLHAARVNYIPYQFKPVLKFVRADSPRLLIADEVGVGKTIEAGLILRELQARRDLRSVLILCPKALVTDKKWERELKRFDETFLALTGPQLRHCIRETDYDGEWPTQYSKAIIPFSLLDEDLLVGDGKGRKGLLDLKPAPRFDLIICDEAHIIRNPETQIHQAVRFMCANAEAVLFLTATPIQLGNRDLFVLLNVLRPDIVRDEATFAHMGEPNPAINRSLNAARAAQAGWQQVARQALDDASSTEWGRAVIAPNPDLAAARALLDGVMTGKTRLEFIRQVEELYTFAHLINRTRRRDIGTFTTRAPETVSIPFTPVQQQLHDRLLAVQASILARFHDVRQISFLMTTIRRQAASCLHGLAPLLQEILTRRDLTALEEDFESDPDEVQDLIGRTVPIEQEIRAVLAQAEQLNNYDPKREALLERIVQKQEMSNNKMLIFSAFRHTLRYLQVHIVNSAVRCAVLHGGVPDEDRQDLRHRFSLPRTEPQALDVLLSSEVGCEGLDYQFCDCLVNYDIPWNPMRVEQRIGRIDRYGQQSEKIVIYNFITPGTVEAEIYERCLTRIGVFRQSIGGSEEILGEIAQRIQSIAEDLRLTDEERKQRLQQLSDNEIRVRQEQQALEDSQADLFGLTLPPAQVDSEVQRANSPWLAPAGIENLVQAYLEKRTGRRDSILGERPLKTLRASQETRLQILADFNMLPRRASPVYRDWERWLQGGQPMLSVTFDAACATDDRAAMFVTPVHPLAQQAARAFQPDRQVFTALRVTSDAAGFSAGSFPFAIYQWQSYGIRTDVTFEVICQAPMPSDAFMALLEHAQPASQECEAPGLEAREALDQQHHVLWLAASEQHKRDTRRIADYRAASLRTSHRKRMAMLRERLARVTDERIRRIPLGEMSAAEADYERRLAAIEQSAASADIVSSPVAYGLLIIE